MKGREQQNDNSQILAKTKKSTTTDLQLPLGYAFSSLVLQTSNDGKCEEN